MSQATPLLEMRGILKTFPGTVACNGANLKVLPGEVHCLLGENGAGKSTLMKILSGSYQPDEGSILINGVTQQLSSPSDGQAAGISIIYQELDLFPDLTVAQNLFMGRSPANGGFIRRHDRSNAARECLRRVGAGFSPEAVVGSLPIADQQLTAIARALTADAKIIVMDEPTATLGEADVQNVYGVIRGLVSEGRSVIYISHRLDEVKNIGDRVTVLRDGSNVAEHAVASSTPDEWIADMIGEKKRELTAVNDRTTPSGEPLLRIERITVPQLIDIEDVEVRQGEIVGLAGLGGAGRTTFLSALFGARHSVQQLWLEGKPFHSRSTRHAISAGFGLVPEDRKTEGLMLGLSVARNAAITSISGARWLFPRSRGRSLVEPVLARLGVKFANSNQAAGELSGGNQQKVVMAKWLARNTRILLLDEPTRGLDVGAKADLYVQVRALADRGAAIIVASSELSELVANADRIFVFHEGRNIGSFDPRKDPAEVIAHAIISGKMS